MKKRAPRSGVIPSAARDLLSRCFAVTLAALREIFDESAYSRYLARNQRVSSGEAYTAFLREKNGGMPRPRCC